MFLRLHGVYLTYLAALLAWTWFASAPPAAGGTDRPGELGAGKRRPLDRALLVPLLAALVALLVRDRLLPGDLSWLHRPALSALFPLAFVATLIQNVAVLRIRGARLTDIPLVLANVGLGACAVVAGATLFGADWGPRADALLADHGVLQHFLGSALAHESSLAWHLPFLLRRREPAGWGGLFGGLCTSALAGFQVAVLVLFLPMSEQFVGRFELEPRLPGAVRANLDTGVLLRADVPAQAAPPGSLTAWVLPADHDGQGLPPAGRPLVVLLRAPDAWNLSQPDVEEFEQAFLAGAERLAGRLRPDVLVPFPEPDGEAIVALGYGEPPPVWRRRFEAARARVAAVSPGTRLGVRLAGSGDRSAELLELLLADPPTVEVAGPRLAPGSLAAGGPAFADTTLAAWDAWLARDESLGRPVPELWVLAAGLSPLAWGTRAQSRFVEGCLARAVARPRVRAILFDAWRDLGATRGLCVEEGVRRPAADVLSALLARPGSGDPAGQGPARQPNAGTDAGPGSGGR